jgi:CRISPR-associated protein Cmr1
MQEAIFTLQTITPLFMAGADQETAELRAPSFRGEMRYWLRALVGGLVGTDTEGLKQVVEQETAVFGATDAGSAIRISLSKPSKEPQEFTEAISKWERGKQRATGKGYLLWSMRLKKPPRYYFPAGTEFQLLLATQGADTINLRRSIASLWLLTQLGGIGSRSRRCAGSLAIQSVKGNITDLPFSTPAIAQALKQQIEQGIKTARALYSLNQQPIRNAQFDVLTKETCRIWILQDERPWHGYEEAMRVIGESLQDYRSTIPIQKRKVFGLPLKGARSSVERRASPLLLRVTKLQGDKYVGIAVLFKTQDASREVPLADYKLIENWADEFRGKQEVTL